MKKKWIILIANALLLAVLLFMMSGFQVRTDTVLCDFLPSEDSNAITIRVSVASSAGYIRAVDVQQGGDQLYCKFYSTFGGLNSSLGAKDTFLLELPPNCTEIFFYRGDGGYDLVLQRATPDSQWQCVR